MHTLITLEFTHGGPLDGEHLMTEWPPEAWYHVAGGFYFLTRYRTNAPPPTTDGTASYWWEPERAGPRLRRVT